MRLALAPKGVVVEEDTVVAEEDTAVAEEDKVVDVGMEGGVLGKGTSNVRES
jgi:hypothetical protein